MKKLLLVFAVIFSFYGCLFNKSWDNYEGGTHLVLKGEVGKDINTSEILTVKNILEKRLNDYLGRNFLLKINNNSEILLQFPSDVKIDTYLTDLILNSYNVEFRLVNEKCSTQNIRFEDIPISTEVLYSKRSGKGKKSYFVYREALITGNNVSDSSVKFDDFENPYLSFEFSEKGSFILGLITRGNIGKRLAIVIDNEVYSAPVIQDKITGGKVQVTGDFSVKDAHILSICLKYPFYPFKLSILKRSSITKELWLGNKDV